MNMAPDHAHLDDEVLSAHIDGESTRAEAAAVSAALGACPACAGRHQDLLRVALAVRSLPSEPPPAAEALPVAQALTLRGLLPGGLRSPRLMALASLAAAAAVGFLVGPDVIPGLRPQATLPAAGAPYAPDLHAVVTDLPVSATAALPAGGSVTLSTAGGRYQPRQSVPVRLILHGTLYDATSVSVTAVGQQLALVIASTDVSLSGTGTAGHTAHSPTPAPLAFSGGGGVAQGSSGRKLVAAAQPHDVALLDDQWAATTPQGAPLDPGSYELIAHINLADGTSVEVRLPIQIT
jgi:anti-sigma factor RsiW